MDPTDDEEDLVVDKPSGDTARQQERASLLPRQQQPPSSSRRLRTETPPPRRPRLLMKRRHSSSAGSSSIGSHLSSLGENSTTGGDSDRSLDGIDNDDDYHDGKRNHRDDKSRARRRKKSSSGAKACFRRTRRRVWYHPWVQKVRRRYRKVPARYKYMCFLLWVSWKFVAAFLVVYLFQSSSSSDGSRHGGDANDSILRLLYIVTASSAEHTIQQSSSWKGSVVDLVSTTSTTSDQKRHHDYRVDVVLILGDAATVDATQKARIRQGLPEAVDLTIWSNAVPFAMQDGKLVENHDALSLQHRFVVKDRWFHYDVFMVWDENIRVHPEHVDYFWNQSQVLWSSSSSSSSEIDTNASPQVTIPGFVAVAPIRTNQTAQVLGTGPFNANSFNSVLAAEGPALLEPTRVMQGVSDDASKVVLLSSKQQQQTRQQQQGWMMTKRQIGRLLHQCPSFLPQADQQPESCEWHRWISLAPHEFSHHFVMRTSPTSSIMPTSDKLLEASPNRLRKNWVDKAPI